MDIVKKILSFFNSPHPIPGSATALNGIGISVTVGVFVAMILYVTGMGSSAGFRGGEVGLAICYGLVSLFITLVFQIVIPSVAFRNTKDDQWTLIKDIFYVLLLVASIAIGNYFISLIIFPDMPVSVASFIEILFSTLLIAIAPITFFLGLSMYRNERKYKKESEQLISIKSEKAELQLVFKSQYAEDPIRIPAGDFYFAEAELNYVRFYYRKEDRVENAMLRTTLKEVAQEVFKEKMIIKAHRSFVINLANSLKFSGNSQGYVIHFDGTDKVARVSRSFTPQVRELLAH